MGISASFPVSHKPPCYLVPSDFSSSGELVGGAGGETVSSHMHEPIEVFMSPFVQQREDINEAKLKFHETDISKLMRRYPKWNIEDLMDFKAQFQSFDMNGDGLIDFKELCKGLDDLGDDSSPDDRRKHFTTLDVDNSGAVDFEEYLELLSAITKNKEPSKMYTNNSPRNIRKLSVVKRIQHGLF